LVLALSSWKQQELKIGKTKPEVYHFLLKPVLLVLADLQASPYAVVESGPRVSFGGVPARFPSSPGPSSPYQEHQEVLAEEEESCP
jgi:hypothetical protein